MNYINGFTLRMDQKKLTDKKINLRRKKGIKNNIFHEKLKLKDEIWKDEENTT